MSTEIGQIKGALNTELYATCDSPKCPLNLFVTAEQVDDYIGAQALLSCLSRVEWLLGDRGEDAERIRKVLKDKGIRAFIHG